MSDDDDRLHGWGERDVLGFYTASGTLDAGEAAAFAAAATSIDGGRILDLGIGTGRTSELLAPRAATYVGVDIAEEMLRAAHRRLPEVDLRVADARDLSSVCVDASIDVVVFSYNGLDALSHSGRVAALREVRRVLAHGGRFVLSSLNQRGVSCGEVPWRPRAPAGIRVPLVSAARGWLGALRHAPTTLRGLANYYRFRGHQSDGDGWSRRLMRAHEFRFVVYYAPPEVTLALLERHGFCFEAAWTNDGTSLTRGELADCHADSVYYLMRAA